MTSAPIPLSEAAAWLKGRDDVAVLCHQSPDGDTFGSGAALVRALRALGKRAQLFCCDSTPERFAFLFEGLEQQDFPPQTIVAVDIADEQLLGGLRERFGGKVQLCIDHHPSNTHYAQRYYVDPKAAATCEIMVDLIPLLGVPLDRSIAIDLYTGLSTDTGCFQYINVTPHTHRVAARLLELDIPAPQINHAMFATKSRQRIALEAAAMQAVEFYRNGEIAVIPLTLEMRQKAGATDDDTDGVASIPRSIEGVRVGATLKEKGPDLVKVSLRCLQPVNASAICGEFGGGGHPGAAGCAIHAGLQEAKEQLLKAINAYLEAHP
mgnify:FL=1